MGRQAIFLSDEKAQEFEGSPEYSKNGHEIRSYKQPYLMESGPKASASHIKVAVKLALICTLIFLAITFTSELLEPRSSRARRSTR